MPNIITYLRYALATTVAVFTFSQYVYQLPMLAIALLLATFGTDVLDGKLARRSSTRIAPEGRVVDSAADSYTFVVVFVVLVHVGATSAHVLLLVVLTRAMFDLTRFVSLACGAEYAAPTTITRAKGFVYAVCTLILYGGHVSGVSWLKSSGVTIALNLVIVAATLVALVSFINSHGAHLARTLKLRSDGPP